MINQMTITMSVTDFKARCTKVLRDMAEHPRMIKVTNRGRVIAIVNPPQTEGADNPAWGALKGTVVKIAADFDEPMGDGDWEAAR